VISVGIKAVKFGGTSLSHAAQMKKAAEIVRSDRERRIVTVSAPGKRFPQDDKITDLLYRMDRAETEEKRNGLFDVIRERFNAIISELGLSLDFSEEYREIARTAHGAALISRGEYFCARIFADLLGFFFVDARELIFFDEKGEPDMKRTEDAMRDCLERYENIVIPGFYGTMPDGTIALFPRGGSDITGAIAAAAANAEVYENFTDVNGFLLADPRTIDTPRTVGELSYEELRRLSSMGACVLHSDSVLPLKAKGIPILIRNTNDPDGTFTRICTKKSDRSVSGIVGQRGYLLFSVYLTGIGKHLEDLRRLLCIFGAYTANVYSTPHTVDAVGVLVYGEDIGGRKEEILRDLFETLHAEAVTVTSDMALVSVIGEGTSSRTARLILEAMAELGAEPLLIDGGADRLGITVGFDERHLRALIERLYEKI
jgi:aspartate kinase